MVSIQDILKQFDMHCLSKEESNSPLIPSMIRLGKLIQESYTDICYDVTLGAWYGKRMIITMKNLDIANVKRTDLIEIVDVDSMKKTILFFGPMPPPMISPLLFMIPYAKQEIQYLISFRIKEEKRKENVFDSLNHITCKTTFIDLLSVVLITLQQDTSMVINDSLVLLTAESLEQMEKTLER